MADEVSREDIIHRNYLEYNEQIKEFYTLCQPKGSPKFLFRAY